MLKIPETEEEGYPIRIRMPRIGAYDGQIGFEDGRHRALLAKQQGLRIMPVAVRRDNVAEVRAVLSKWRGRPDENTQRTATVKSREV